MTYDGQFIRAHRAELGELVAKRRVGPAPMLV
jgi:hypothetical protein